MTFFQTFSTEPQVVSTSMQPRRSRTSQLADGDAERRQDHHVVRRHASNDFAGIAREADAHRPHAVVHVGVVDDLAGQEDAAVGKAARLIGVVDRAVDAVAEAELPRQIQTETAGLETVVRCLDLATSSL